MELQTKSDLEEALKRFEAWWHGEILDRPPVAIDVERAHPPRMPPAAKTHASLRERWLDHEYAIDRFEAGLDGAVFVAESFPRYMPNVGPELCGTLFGCELEFSEGTSWSIPVARSCREVLQIPCNLEGPYWSNIRAATDSSLERGQGRWITCMPDLHSNGDLLAALRDPQDLCLECADDLDAVAEACSYVTDYFPETFDDLWRRIAARGQPCTSWLPALHDGRLGVLQCDFNCMISPAMFERAILPALKRETEFVSRSIYHLDGPDAIRHLDLLLAVPDLHAIQWVYGAGNGPAARWIDLYQRIQASGKALQLIAADLDDARAVAEHLQPEGVWLCPGGTYTLDEAEDFLRWTADWAAGKKA